MSCTELLPWLLAVLYIVHADKVLLVSHQFKSHLIQVHMVGEGLASKGHQVYSIMQHGLIKPEQLPMKGIQPIYVYTAEDTIWDFRDLEKRTCDEMFKPEPDFKILTGFGTKEATESCGHFMHDETLLNVLRNHHFDLAVVDDFLLAPCIFLVPYVLGIKYVSVGLAAGMYVGGIPNLPSFVPVILFPFSDDMTFTERIQNFFLSHLTTTRLFFPNENLILLEEFAPEISSWYVLVERSLIHCVSKDHILSWPAPSMPNVIHTPGITIKPARPLPTELESIISSNDLPVVIVTFGSMFANLPEDVTRKFITAFSEVNYTIIWRLDIESSSPVTMPDNVHVVSWLPQNDLLGHPATKLFITHCGNNGQYEAVYHGVPMIGFPLFAEQPHNCFRMEYHQLGKCMDIRTFDPNVLVEYINEVAADGSIYQRNVKKRSSILLGTDARPVGTCVRWIEHVMTHGGEHLHSHAVDMPWYQYWMLDVLAFILIIIFLILIAVIRIVRKLCCSKKRKEKHQ